MSNYRRYHACQNEFLIFELKRDSDWQSNRTFRKTLSHLGKKNNVDSILILKGSPHKFYQQGYHYEMYVFEPHARDENDLAGRISTMCGNGIRAVAAFIQKQFPGITEARIMTLSGLRTVEIDGNLYTVNMGNITTKNHDLKNYVNTKLVPVNNRGDYINSPIPKEIFDKLSAFINVRKWSIGLNGSRNKDGNIDGEPHVIVEVPSNLISDISKLRKLAVTVGPFVTKNIKFFPREINVNFIVVTKKGKVVETLNCTHERNLGDDADHSVTSSCGTGSTLVGGLILERYLQAKSVLVRCSGGDLTITKSLEGQDLLMKGPAVEVMTD